MVVLPAPLGPTNATNCPGSIVNVTSSSAMTRAWLLAGAAPAGVPPDSTASMLCSWPGRYTRLSRCRSSTV